MARVTAEVVDTIIMLRRAQWSYVRIASHTGVAKVTVFRVLKKAGAKLNPKGKRWLKCVDCGKPTDGARRCKLHARVRKAQQDRDRMRQTNKVKPKNYRMSDLVDSGYYGPTKGEWFNRQSGPYGPVVRQLEQTSEYE